MRVLYFGTYDRAYPRNAQVISALRGAGVEVREQHRGGLGASAQLVGRRCGSCCASPRPSGASAGRGTTSSGATRSSSAIPVTSTFPPRSGPRAGGRSCSTRSSRSTTRSSSDRGRFRRGSPGAGRRPASSTAVPFAGRMSSSPTRRPTPRSFARSSASPPDRVEVCFVGAEDRLFRPGWQPDAPFHALFVGKLIPLHGLETILAAAALAPEIPFRIVGSGQLESPPRTTGRRTSSGSPGSSTRTCRARSRPRAARSASSGRARRPRRVIPNKAFQATRLRHAARDGRHACGPGAADRRRTTRSSCRRAIPSRSPAAVRRLAAEPALADGVGAAGRATYEARASEAALGAALAGAARARDRRRVTRPRALLWLAVGALRRRDVGARVLQQRAFETGRFDVGNLTQAVWSTAHGRFLEITDLQGDQISRLGAHFDPIVALLAPALVALASVPSLLLVVQAVGVSLGAVPVFLLARKHLGVGLGGPRLRARLPPLPADAVARRRRLPPGRVRNAAAARRDLVPRRGPAAAVRALRRARRA